MDFLSMCGLTFVSFLEEQRTCTVGIVAAAYSSGSFCLNVQYALLKSFRYNIHPTLELQLRRARIILPWRVPRR
jgi:hypothetical protein